MKLCLARMEVFYLGQSSQMAVTKKDIQETQLFLREEISDPQITLGLTQ